MSKFSRIVIFFTLAICFLFAVQNRWKGGDGDAWKGIIYSDGYGYYAYLPCIFIYHKLDYQRAWAEVHKVAPGAAGFTTTLPDNKVIDKCFAGVAILLIPFFLIAYFLSSIFGYGNGGYEFIFQASVSIGALFYLGVGLVFLYKLLKRYNIPEFIACLTLLLVVFGTNLIYYATMEPSMSHVYSFGIMSVFLFYSKKSMAESKLRYFILITICLGVLTLIRPTNLLIIVFVPFLAGNTKATAAYIKQFFNSKKLLALFLIATGFLFVQSLLWYMQTGHFFVWSYPGEGFKFNEFHFFDILFSYSNGWFIYSPLMFIATMGGLFTLYRQSIFQFFIVLLFFIVVTYILSSWWAWTYSGAYGLRAFVDFYCAFSLLLALFISSIKTRWLQAAVIISSFLCIGLNLFQINQYINSILPPGGMTKEKYWKIFLKNDPSYHYLFNYADTSGFHFLNSYDFKNDFEKNTWGGDQDITITHAHSGVHSAFVNEQNQYSPIFSLTASDIQQTKPLHVLVTLWVYMPNFNTDASVVVSLKTEKGECYLWAGHTLQGFVFKTNVWSKAYAFVALPTFKNPSDILNVYVLNTKGEVYLDDMEIKFGMAN